MKKSIGKCGGKLIFFGLISSAIFLTVNCSSNTPKPVTNKNLLSYEMSPYLLQHSENPVHWRPWNEDAFEQARERNCLVIVSIGYSSCHWCHVMAHESFEDTATAEIMNENFVSIKVDREERPDVDQVYMTALQLMSGRGGWPLNVVCLPDGRPVWGATYLPRDQWQQALTQLSEMYATDSARMLEYAQKLTEGIQQAELLEPGEIQSDFSKDDVRKMVNIWASRFDTEDGGTGRAPKFPMPVNLAFLLEYGVLDQNARVLRQVELTLDKMAAGGIFDQVGGGFSRYATDKAWTVPHFEKMLYDNAQLLSVYSHAYRYFKHDRYRQVILAIVEWLDREMLSPYGGYYSAVDADSEGEEGKYYVWSESELRSIIKENEWDQFTSYFDLKKGLWEGKIILTVRENASVNQKKLQRWKKLLFAARDQRKAPEIDDKQITSWNALLISGLVDAAKALRNSDPEVAIVLRDRAVIAGEWINLSQSRIGEDLYHSSRKGNPAVDGLIEDFAYSIQAFLDMYEYTNNYYYFKQIQAWVDMLELTYMDKESRFYYTRPVKGKQLIARSIDRVDNVMPSPNSVMAMNLWRLGEMLEDSYRTDHAVELLGRIDRERLLNYGESYSNWGRLMLRLTFPTREVVITGPNSQNLYYKLQSVYTPNTIWAWSEKEDLIPLFRKRHVPDQSLVYICEDHTCMLPVSDAASAIRQLEALF